MPPPIACSTVSRAGQVDGCYKKSIWQAHGWGSRQRWRKMVYVEGG
jgi:hypothetical protein